MSGPDVLIVGGGVIGLGIGWQLAKAGRSVTVVERDPADLTPPSAAAWGAGGMLAPLAEGGFDGDAELALGRESLARYPEWAAELEADAGEGVGYRTEGTLAVALDRDDAAWLERQYRYQQSLGLPVEWLSGREALEREPHLVNSLAAAVLVPTDHQVDARRMWRALRSAFRRAGGTLRAGTEVTGIALENGRAAGAWIRPSGASGADGERICAASVVVCGGAWTRLLMKDSVPAVAVPPVRPVKGQLLVLEMSPLLTLEMVVRSRRVYLVPKESGRLIVGATSEEVGFDTRLTAGGVLDLLREGWETVPGIYDLPLLETWAGLRPASRDHAPVLGRTPVDGLFVATGHYRNGVLLTPITAHLMRELLVTGREPEMMRPFGITRFRT